MLGRQPEIARQILRKLLVGRLVLMPDATARTYTMQGRASYGRLLDGIIPVAGLVPPGWIGRDRIVTGTIRAA
jgi:hypothetical protein